MCIYIYINLLGCYIKLITIVLFCIYKHILHNNFFRGTKKVYHLLYVIRRFIIVRFSLFSGLRLETDDNTLMCDIMMKEENAFEKNSAMALLWDQQKKVSRLKKSSSMKWHPVIIRWCLSIYLKSPGMIR